MNGPAQHVGGDARADDDDEIEEVVVIGRPIQERPTYLEHMQFREWLDNAQGEIRARIEEEANRVTLCDQGDCVVTLLDWLIASIEDDVADMDDCIRDSISARDRENSTPHRFDYKMGASPEARYDPSSGTYITVLDPLAVNNASGSLLHEWITHELAHHITYDPETGRGTANHGQRFWDVYDAIEAASSSCRG